MGAISNAKWTGVHCADVLKAAGIPIATADEPKWGGLPPGEGREETFAFCTACHSAKLIMQQGMTRDQWEETLAWMVEEQGMPEPPPQAREQILDYLASQFSPAPPHYRAPGP